MVHRTALITGASSGLGAEFARQLAARGDDLVLVARGAAALEALAVELRAEHGVAVEVLPADLTEEAAVERVAARVADPVHPVDVLVNNAGYGLGLDFARNAMADEAAHLRIHVETPLRLSHAAYRAMLERGHGRVINVASVAGFLPRSTYGAVKGFLIQFSRWANVKYRPRGVTTTAVCPGFTHTSFHARMGLPPGQEGVARGMWLDARLVVREALRDAERGRAVSIPSLRYKLIVGLTRLIPANLLARLAEQGR